MNAESEHFSVEDFGNSLRCVFRKETQWIAAILLLFGCVFFLAFFSPILINLVILLWNGIPAGVSPIFLPFMGIPCVLLLLWSVEALWRIFGKEVVEIGYDDIVIRHQVFGIGIGKRLKAEDIGGVFASRQQDRPEPAGFGSRDLEFLNFKRGRIAVDCGKNFFGGVATFRFGPALDAGEVGRVLAIIHDRFPAYRYRPDASRQ
jgi:hypothetical protein